VIAARRLRAHRLTGTPFSSPIDAVRWLGAVQSQDYGAGKWALGLRTGDATEGEVDQLFDEGAILRTHVLRPTWHFALPEDIRWLIDLTGPRLRASLAHRRRTLELDNAVIARAANLFGKALAGGRHLTRPQLGDVLLAGRMSIEGQRLPHLIMDAELDGLVVSGPRSGKQFTYALLDERAPQARRVERADAVVELARRYFTSHGPAQLHDFAWWSGLTTADARAGIADAELAHEIVDGKEYWFDAAARSTRSSSVVAHLLPNFDEYTVASRDRAAALHADLPFDRSFFSFGSILSNVVIIDGRVRGAWRRTMSRGDVRVEVKLLERVTEQEQRAVENATRRFGRFLQKSVELIMR
jgi:Winged helix DNA-binding domain